jgi:bile acid:Na+ symporter, BASS family
LVFSGFRNFSSVIVILVSVTLGLILPQIGAIWQPYTIPILGFLMFMVALNISPKVIIKSIQDYKSISLALIIIFIIAPLLAIPSQFFFSPTQYLAIVLALSSPAAISSVFWCSIFKGYTPLALVISVSSNLLSIITIPLTIFLIAGLMTPIDTTSIVVNLIYLIVIPVITAQIIRKFVPNATRKIVKKSGLIQHVIFFLLLWGAVSPGAMFTRTHPLDFLFFNLFFLFVFSIIFVISFLIGARYGRKTGVALAVVSSHKNSVLAIVIGSLLLGPEALSPLISNVVAQNIFLVPARLALGKETK